MKNRHSFGRRGESLAIGFLKKQGYTILETNFRFERAEIDLIAKDRGVLVFVEVKTRRKNTLGEPEDAVTGRKLDQIRKAAQGYLYKRDLADAECRFDVVSIKQSGDETEISHIRDAF